MMDINILSSFLTVVASSLFVLGATSVNGDKLVVFNKPFFSTNLGENEAFKNVKVFEETEQTTIVGSPKSSSRTKDAFICTPQEGNNKVEGYLQRPTLHDTPTTSSREAFSPDASHHIRTVTTSPFTLGSPSEVVTTSGVQYPSGYDKKLHNSFYKFVDSRETLSEARSTCKRDSAHLVFIENKEENDFLLGEAKHDTQYWIGIHERPNIFWDNGNQVTYANFNPDDDKTFNEDGKCYRMSGNTERYWFDKRCGENFGFICECEGTECPSGYETQFEDSHYNFHDSGVETLSEARSACKGDGAHLVFIETKEENDFLLSQAKTGSQYWIGIHKRPNIFWDNGNQVTYANINPDDDKTFNEGGECYRMSSDTERYWFDKPCGENFGFICECEGTNCSSEYNKNFTNSHYKFVDSPQATLPVARSTCKNDFNHLVFIETKEENNFLVRAGNERNSEAEYWIGIHKRSKNLFWDNGNDVTFANFDLDGLHTLDLTSGCFGMSLHGNRHWLGFQCSERFGYICECEGHDCLPGYNKTFNNSKYKFVDYSTATLSKARSLCKSNSSHLVFIETKEENDFLIQMAVGDTKYWIGIHQRPNLFWDNGNQVIFFNINPDNAVASDEGTGCYRMTNMNERYWSDSPCTGHYGFICEYEMVG